MHSDDEEDYEEGEAQKEEEEEQDFERNNKYGGFDKYGAAYRNRQVREIDA